MLSPALAPPLLTLTTEQRPVEGELLRQVLDVGDALVHGPGEVVGVVQAAQDDAGEVDWLCEVAHEGTLDAHHVPPAQTHTCSRNQWWNTSCFLFFF